jgi:DNA-directed RNA polymerase subunit RPC12/RpoP
MALRDSNILRGILMNDILDFFVCDACSSKDFNLVYNFCLRFHGVNFSDDLIYDEIVEEKYQCSACKKTFTKKDVKEALSRLRKKRKRR